MTRREYMQSNFKRSFLLLVAYFVVLTSFGQVRLPRLVSDGMVLQRDASVRIWGWASPDENVTVNFIDAKYSAKADKDGNWSITLPKLKSGGPFDMKISASNEVVIHNILIGDVWVCSGQSNMEYVMMGSRSLYENEIANARNTFIRQFKVPRMYTFEGELNDVSSGTWQSADPNTVLRFSAVAWFFARELYARYGIPIGIINSTLGGSRTESWMSEDALKEFPNHFQEYKHYQDTAYVANVVRGDRERIGNWYERALAGDEGYKDNNNLWRSESIDESDWINATVPGFWGEGNIGAVNGVVWFRKHFDAPAPMVQSELRLSLGNIVDADSTFINGVYVGSRGSMYAPRNYSIPANLLKAGKNTIVVRIVNTTGNGGFIPDKSYAIVSENDTINLSGAWKYKIGVKMESLAGPTFVMWKPGGLYNGMVAPLLPYTIKGVIWYQGESNVGRAVEQRTLFPAMIKNWREKWGQGDFPFLYIQLPNYLPEKPEPSESSWAMFREAQQMTLSQPNTGMAVAIDVGEWNDIHPLNKKDVGYRLALVARHHVYGENKIVYTGPVYQSMKVKGNKATISFDNVGGGLVSRDNKPLKEFAVAGSDKKYYWATAVIKDNKVEVWSEDVSKPVAVRYAWADSPLGVNLYNKEGLPAAPFRTDDF